MPELTSNFGGLDGDADTYENAATVVLPVPFERTTSYGKGTIGGPAAILRASQFVDLYDEELDLDLEETGGIATAAPFAPESFDMAEALAEIETEARRHMDAGKLLVTLGGEHSLTLAPVRAAREVHGEIGVVQFDAHADLRQEYEGTPHSHASVMRRVDDLGLPVFGVGLRSLSRPEGELIRGSGRPVIWGHELERAEELFDAGLERLPERVYLTFDLDFFDPSLLPATGTPEPGGGFWTPTLRLLRRLFEAKDVVAMDVVELAPIGGQPASDFVAAKLVFKCLAYRYVASSSKVAVRSL